MKAKKIHFAGTHHVPPETGSKGYLRVVERGCAGPEDDSCDANCAQGYTWRCEDCPVIRHSEDEMDKAFHV